jgi:hypothetical protein
MQAMHSSSEQPPPHLHLSVVSVWNTTISSAAPRHCIEHVPELVRPGTRGGPTVLTGIPRTRRSGRLFWPRPLAQVPLEDHHRPSINNYTGGGERCWSGQRPLSPTGNMDQITPRHRAGIKGHHGGLLVGSSATCCTPAKELAGEKKGRGIRLNVVIRHQRRVDRGYHHTPPWNGSNGTLHQFAQRGMDLWQCQKHCLV